MVGRKSNLKYLIAKLWDVGVTIVKTTEFVQGRTSRWGLAWSFIPPKRNTVLSDMVKKTSLTFTLEVQPKFLSVTSMKIIYLSNMILPT